MWADDHRNIVIPRRINGYFMRGSYDKYDGKKVFKRTSGSKECGEAILYGIRSKDRPVQIIIFCEGITDGIALCDINPDSEIRIISGSSRPAIDMKSIKDNAQIYFAFDADDGGKGHLAYYKNIFPVHHLLPPPQDCKDWGQAPALFWRLKQQTLNDTEATLRPQ